MNGKWLAIGAVGGLVALSARKRGSSSTKIFSLRHPEGLVVYGDEPWREPDFESVVFGEPYALWWGPSEKFEDAESIVEVEGRDVREYTCLAGYVDEPEWEEGRPDWTVQEIELDDESIAPFPPSIRHGNLQRSDPRWMAAIALEMISEGEGYAREYTVTQQDIDDLDPGPDRLRSKRAPA